MATKYGYARVSTTSQDLTLQQEALAKAGCAKVYYEKLSGARSDNRPQLCRLLKVVNVGDVVIVTRLDRLARSTRDLLNTVHELTEAGAKLRSIAEPWCDTTTPLGELVMTILGGIAAFERSLIMARTQAGIAKAREIGKDFGRPPKLNARQKRMIADRYAQGGTMQALADEFGVSQPTIWRAVHGVVS